MAEDMGIEQEKVLLTWKAKSRPFNPDQERSRTVLIVLGVLLVVIFAFAGEWMLITLMAAGAFYYYAQNRVVPEEVDYSITNKGLKAFGRVYLWWEMRRWWVEAKINENLLVFDLTTGLMGRMYVPMGNVKQPEVEKVMAKYLIYEKPAETAVDRMTKWVAEKFPLENKI